MSQKSFADLGVSRAVAAALRERGVHTPFPIQELVIADVLAGRDVLAKSPTGSGKTLAFGVPLVDRIAADAKRPAALILAPTRELAGQIVDELRPLARVRNLDVAYRSVYSPDGAALLPFAGTLNPRSIPSTVVLDADGRIAASVNGRVPTTQTLVDLVEKVLDE